MRWPLSAFIVAASSSTQNIIMADDESKQTVGPKGGKSCKRSNAETGSNRSQKRTKPKSDNFADLASQISELKKCNDVTREIELWCIKINNFVQVVHLPGSKNVEADEESRIDRREIEWKLDPSFSKLFKRNLVYVTTWICLRPDLVIN